MEKKYISIAAGTFIGLLFVTTAFGGFYTVEQKEAAVVTKFGAFNRVAGPGLHFKAPWIESVTVFHTALQQVEIEKSEAFTSDNQSVQVTMLVQFNVPDSDVQRLYEHVPNYERRIYTLANDRMKAAFGSRQVAEVPAQRSQIEAEILKDVTEQAMRLYGVEITEVQLTDLDYTQTFRQSIDQMTRAKAEVTKAEQLRQQAIKDAERQQIAAKADADAHTLAAKGDADSLKLRAQAEADAVRLKGEAEADAIKAQAAALGASPNYVQYEQAKQWDGKLPATIMGSSALPILKMDGKGE